MEGNMTYEDQKKELYFANAVIGAIDNVKTPITPTANNFFFIV